MSRHSDQDAQRARLIGLGERSFQKSYYPELRRRLAELERFRALLDQAGDSIFLVTLPESQVADCNDSAAKRLGRGRKELIGRDLTDIFPSLARCLNNPEACEPALPASLPSQPMVCMLEAKGAPYPAEITLAERTIEGRRYALIVARDVTDRQRAEEALRAAEEKYRSIFEKALEGIYQASLQGRLLSANPAMADIFGYASAQEMIDTLTDVQNQLYLYPEERDAFMATLRAHGQVKDRELRLLRKDGTVIWISVSARLVRDANGSPLFVEGFLTDITARKKAQEELAALNRRLEGLVLERTADLARKAQELESANQRLLELDALKNALLSSVSHELRTPLTSVLGFTRIIEKDFTRTFLPLARQDPTLHSKARRIGDNLEIIRQESERLTRMINDFLDISKIESGRLEWNDCFVMLKDAVSGAVHAVQGQLEQKPGLQLTVDVQEGLPPVRVDPDRLFQVLINLLQNAMKFTAHGSIVLRAVRDDDGIRITVTDTGVGIPEQELHKVFNKFHQAQWDDAQGSKPPGTGLGLSICKQIVEHYGGRVWVESAPGQGSSFHFTLPLPESLPD